MSCVRCSFLMEVVAALRSADRFSDRLYWIITEIFVWLHGGKDYCKK